MATQESYLTEVAANSEWTVEELIEADEKIERAIQSQLTDHFKWSCLRAGPDYVLRIASDKMTLALSESDLRENLVRADIDVESGKVRAVATAWEKMVQDRGATIEIPGAVARSTKDNYWYPIEVRFPESWNEATSFTYQRFQELVWRYDMSPAEALDYWVVEILRKPLTEWADKRGVRLESVRKNVRQADDKLTSKHAGSANKDETFRLVPLGEIPEGEPHDAERDKFYIPTEGSLDGWEPDE